MTPGKLRLVPVLDLYVGALALCASGTALVLAYGGHSLGNVWVVACLATVAALAEVGDVKLTATTYISISLLPTLFAAIMFGPLAAMLVAAASMLGDVRGPADRPYLRWLSYTSTRSLTAAVAGLVAVVLQDLIPSPLGGVVAAATVGALVAESLDVGFATLTNVIRGKGEATVLVRTLGPLVLTAVPLYAPVVALLVVSYQKLSPWTLPLFLVPALAAQRLYFLYQTERELTKEVLEVNDQLERANLSFATALVTTLDARDQYTAGHSAAVSVYSRDIADAMGLSQEVQQMAHLSGLLHDIGKIGLPAGLLEKPSALTLEERRTMESHSVIGERILVKVEDYAEIANIVRHHHERLDGLGYPDALREEAIPIISRIIGVADAYNAMTSDRPYRAALESSVARMRLALGAGAQFDRDVVAAFDAILEGADENYRSGSRADFQLEAQAARHEEPLLAAAV